MDGLVLEEDLADVPAAPGMTFDTSFAPIAKLPPSQQPTPRGGSLGGRPPLPPTPTGRTSNSGLRASFGSQPFPQQLGDSLMSSQEGFGLGHSDISLPGLEGREHSFSSVGSGRRLGRKVGALVCSLHQANTWLCGHRMRTMPAAAAAADDDG